MAIQIVDNFGVNTGAPIDSRTQVADIAARDAIDSVQRFDGLAVEVLDRGDGNRAIYQLQGGTANSNWIGISEDTGFLSEAPSSGSLVIDCFGIAHIKRTSSLAQDFTYTINNLRPGAFLTHHIINTDSVDHQATLSSGKVLGNGGNLGIILSAGKLTVVSIYNQGTLIVASFGSE